MLGDEFDFLVVLLFGWLDLEIFSDFLPFSGIFVLNGVIIVANDTEDNTAQLMLKLCHQIWVKGTYKSFLKEVA